MYNKKLMPPEVKIFVFGETIIRQIYKMIHVMNGVRAVLFSYPILYKFLSSRLSNVSVSAAKGQSSMRID